MKTVGYFIHELISLCNRKKNSIVLTKSINIYYIVIYGTRYYFAALCRDMGGGRRDVIKVSSDSLSIHNDVNVYICGCSLFAKQLISTSCCAYYSVPQVKEDDR